MVVQSVTSALDFGFPPCTVFIQPLHLSFRRVHLSDQPGPIAAECITDLSVRRIESQLRIPPDGSSSGNSSEPIDEENSPVPFRKTLTGLPEDSIVFAMRPNPYPDKPLLILHSQRPVTYPGTRRPKFSHFLELKGGMAGISLEQIEFLSRCPLNRLRKAFETSPKSRRGTMH